MPKIGFGVKSIIMKDGKFLVLVKPGGDPDIPGGRMENGETERKCLHREIVEETGLHVDIFNAIAQWSFYKHPQLLIAGMTYLCGYNAGDVSLSDEHSDYFWADFNQIDGLGLSRWFRKAA